MPAKRVLFVSPSPAKRRRTMVVKAMPARNRGVRRTVRGGSKIVRKSSRGRSRIGYKALAKRAAGLKAFGPPNSKQTLRLDQSNQSIPSRTWGAVNLCSIPHNLNNVQNARSGQEAHITGFLHKTNWMNITQSIVAVWEYWVVPRNYDAATVSDATLQDDFHSRHGFESDRDGTWAANLPFLLYDEPVNPEKYLVLKKRRFKLGPSSLGTTGPRSNAGSLPCYREFKDFIKLNRKFTYGVQTDTESVTLPIQAPVFYINFCVEVMTEGGQLPVPGTCLREAHIITYFRDGDSGL